MAKHKNLSPEEAQQVVYMFVQFCTWSDIGRLGSMCVITTPFLMTIDHLVQAYRVLTRHYRSSGIDPSSTLVYLWVPSERQLAIILRDGKHTFPGTEILTLMKYCHIECQESYVCQISEADFDAIHARVKEAIARTYERTHRMHALLVGEPDMPGPFMKLVDVLADHGFLNRDQVRAIHDHVERSQHCLAGLISQVMSQLIEPHNEDTDDLSESRHGSGRKVRHGDLTKEEFDQMLGGSDSDLTSSDSQV